MNRFEQDRLLREILTGEELARFRQASLEQGLSQLHRRQRRQRVLRFSSLAALALSAVLLGRHFLMPAGRATASTQAPLPGVNHPVEYITDDQLLALFPDRSVALIGPPGQQQFVFLR
jgi:hypothetical protein